MRTAALITKAHGGVAVQHRPRKCEAVARRYFPHGAPVSRGDDDVGSTRGALKGRRRCSGRLGLANAQVDGTLDDFSELVVLFGFVALFGLVFPLGPVFGALMVRYEYGVDVLKLSYMERRSFPPRPIERGREVLRPTWR